MKLELNDRQKSNLVSILFAYIEYVNKRVEKRERCTVLHQRILEAKEILNLIKEKEG